MNTKDFKTRSETIHRAAPCPANHWIIGLDIGYSAIKGMSPNKIYSVNALTALIIFFCSSFGSFPIISDN